LLSTRRNYSLITASPDARAEAVETTALVLKIVDGDTVDFAELLGLRWIDFDADAATVTVADKLVRATGHGLTRIDDNTKSAAGKMTLPLRAVARNYLDALAQFMTPGHLGESTYY
jgi:hypothetical protein